MDFEHTSERRMLIDTVERYLADRYGIEEREHIAFGPAGWSRDHWRNFAELGIVGALFPDEQGGYGGSALDIASLFEAFGHGLVVEPFHSTLIAGRLLRGTAETQLVQRMIAGEAIIGLALAEPAKRYDLADVSACASVQGDSWSINGTKTLVLHAGTADTFLVSARLAEAPSGDTSVSLFAVEADAPGVCVSEYALIDGGRAGNVKFENAPARLVGDTGSALQSIEMANCAGLLALCWEAVGIMDIARAQTLEYLRTRQQFGQPIGQFQALKHRMAIIALEIEQARSAATNAAAHLDADRITRERAASAAKFTICRTGILVAEEAIQMHGGMGMTWDMPISQYAKRLVMIGQILGDEDHHLDRYIDLAREQV